MDRLKKHCVRNIAGKALVLAVLILLFISCEDLLNALGDSRSRLLDYWIVDESLPAYKSGEEIYHVEISEHPTDSTRILISNFFNVGANAMAEAVLSGKTLSLSSQTISGGFTVTGSGTIHSDWNSINWSYTVDDGSGVPETYTAVYTRLE